jgi:hypothetical protein
MFANLYSLLLVILSFNLMEGFVFNKTKLEDIRKRLVEGDILIDHQFHGLRYGLEDSSKRWPSAKVYYLFSSLHEFYAQEKSLIRQAMNEIETHSCLRFIELVRIFIINFYYMSTILTSNKLIMNLIFTLFRTQQKYLPKIFWLLHQIMNVFRQLVGKRALKNSHFSLRFALTKEL